MPTANDNEPAQAFPRGDSVGYRAALREKQGFAKMQADKLKHYNEILANKPTSRDPWFLFALLLWIGAISFFTHTFANSDVGLTKIATSVGLIFTGLWVGHAAQVRGRDRFGDIAIFTAVIGCAAGLYTCINDLSMPLTLAEALGALTVMTLISAALLRSRICLIVSACISVIALIFHFNGMAQSYSLIMFYPAIWILQALYASMMGSRLTLLGMNVIGYFWIIGTGITTIDLGVISPSLGMSALFAVGTLHYHFGKFLISKPNSGAPIHIVFGWSAAVVAAVIITYDAFNGFNLVQRGPAATPLGMALWKLAIIGLTAACGLVALLQKQNSRFRFTRAVIAALACASLPTLILFNPQISLWISQRPTLDGIPIIGLAISAAILANAMMMIIYGVYQRRMAFILTALLAMTVLVGLFLKPEYISPENGIVLAGAFVVSLIISGWSLGYNVNFNSVSLRR